jgi:hypothetical protein
MSDLKVEDLSSALPTPELWGSFKVKGVAGNRLELIGWVLGRQSEVTRIEIVARGRVVATARPEKPRPEVAEQMPERPTAATSGFELMMEGSGKGKSVLELRAVLDDGTAAQMGQMRVVVPPPRWTSLLRRR